MALKLFECGGGHVALPDRKLVLVSREDGGNLIVNPPREVWDRSELTSRELTLWSFLVAATGRAMLDVLPQLDRGCINYWDAGNWALNDAALPSGRKSGPEHRRLHLHLLGRSRESTHPAWRWGEAPSFPEFADRHAWAARFERLRPDECVAIVARLLEILRTKYEMPEGGIVPWERCSDCGYPTPGSLTHRAVACEECVHSRE